MNCLKKSCLANSVTFILIFLLTNVYIISLKENDNELGLSRLFNIAEKLRTEGDFLQSIIIFEKSLSIAIKKADRAKECESLIKLGLLYWNIGKLKESSDYYNRAFSIAKKNQLKYEEYISSNSLRIYKLYNEGKAYRSSRDFQRSIKSFRDAIKIAQYIESKDHEVKCLRQLSATYWILNELNEFLSLNEEAYNIAQTIRHKKEMGKCLNNIGIYHDIYSDYSKALHYYQKALEIAQDMNDKIEESILLNNMGIIYKNIGNYDKAIDYLEKSLVIDRQLNNTDYISKDLNNIGNLYRKKALISGNKEDYNKALNYYCMGLELAKKSENKKTEIQVINNIGTIYTDLENCQEALKYFKSGLEEAEHINDIESTGMILNNIGIIYYNLDNYEESTKYYQRAINLALQISGSQILWEAYLEQAKALGKQNKLGQALESYKNSISIIENIRSQIKLEELKASYLGTDKRIEAYHNIIDLLVTLYNSDQDRGYDQEAFNYLERAKARAFLDSLEISQLNISQGIDPKLLNKENELMKDISKLYTKLYSTELSSQEKNKIHEELKEYEDKLESLKREIRTLSPVYANLKYPEIISLEDTQNELLDNQSAFFAYSIGKEKSYLFVVTKKSLKIFPVPNREELRNRVSEYLKTITDKDSNRFQVGYELYADLVLPGLKEEMKNLIFIPDDILHFLPFEALITQEKSRDWLVQNHQIAYIPSISSYREIANRKNLNTKNPKKDILAFADPSFGSLETEENGGDVFQDFFSSTAFNFSRLKYSDYEIQKIGSLFKKTKRKIFKRDLATEEEVKNHDLENYKIIHFATHSLIDDKKPARSSIVLTLDDDPIEDGFLQMREVYNLKLNADIVVLSACQTGLGQFINGEGIEGLNRAFFYAGASSVLMSLWGVNDQASSQLMERFYHHLRAAESPVNALRKTKLEMISSSVLSHPYYWAGFIVSGKTNDVLFRNNTSKYIIFGILILLGSGFIFIVLRKIRH